VGTFNKLSLDLDRARTRNPAVYTSRIPTLTTSTQSCKLLTSHNRSLDRPNNQASTIEKKNDRLITASASLRTLRSHLFIHLERPYPLHMTTLVNSNVFHATSADSLPDEQRLCNLERVTCVCRSFDAETKLPPCLSNQTMNVMRTLFEHVLERSAEQCKESIV
jgi:hypothetical protein